MAKIKVYIRYLIFLLVLVATTLTVNSLNLNVEIAESAEHRTVDLQQSENFSNIHKVNFTVENTGSVGCVYRARTMYNYENSNTDESWSRGYSLWPGETERISTVNVIDNRSEVANVTVTINYCGRNARIESNELSIDAGPVNKTSKDNLLAEVDNESASVFLNQDADMIVPKESPDLWRLSHSKVESRESHIYYDPPIFRDRELEYYILDDGEVEGVTSIDLDKNQSLRERLQVLIRKLQLNV